jgi:tmRNA-binding protein
MNNIQEILTTAIKQVLNNSSDDKKIKALMKKHDMKIHFIPYRYRVFGGILQSMNIQFGNFLEKVMTEVLRQNSNLEIIEKYSGKKNNKFKISANSEEAIDKYITDCQVNNYTDEELVYEFNNLLSSVKDYETDTSLEVNDIIHDVDILFKDKSSGVYYYIEVKYNDDHDTGKFMDINRKIIKTYASIQRELGNNITLIPILFYFTNKRMKGNIYLPEKDNIYRGKKFFDTFTNIKYEDMDSYMRNISEKQETIQIFDNLYNKIIKGVE